MKIHFWIAVVAIVCVSACNYTVGECWPVGQGDGSAGVGGSGVLVPGGTGDFGDPPSGSGDTKIPEADCNRKPEASATPETGAGNPDNQCPSGAGSDGVADTYTFCSGPCASKCSVGGIHHFSASDFKFLTTVADDGKDDGGGWQEAVVNLKIRRWTSWFPESWTCPIRIGTPVRSLINGKISPQVAASISAEVATNASDVIMTASPTMPQGIFCLKFKDEMNAMMKKIIPGARVEFP